MHTDLTQGKVLETLLKFALPFLLASFLQTFYGMADLYVIGRFYGASSITAVSTGSQIMHFVTVILIGLAMGTTVHLGHTIGAGKYEHIRDVLSNTILLFALLALGMVLLLSLNVHNVVAWMKCPEEAVQEMTAYLKICFLGVPFIVSYNVLSAIFRGAGDSKSPMIFVGISCVVNILLDFLMVGGLHMAAAGAAIATVSAQALSSIVALFFLVKKDFGFDLKLYGLHFDAETCRAILRSGLPIALQDGFIQVSFLLITVIANARGLIDASAVGIVEKLISFFFLVPSAFLSALSALVAINMGASRSDRCDQLLSYSLKICIGYGLFIIALAQWIPSGFLSLFTKDASIIAAGTSYLRSYCTDTLFAGIHFCFSGYFCGAGHSMISFVHNILSIILVRIPGAYLASVRFPDTLFPMGLAAPLGSFLSVLICVAFYRNLKKKAQE